MRADIALAVFGLVAGLAWFCAAAGGCVWGTGDAGLAAVLGAFFACGAGAATYALTEGYLPPAR